MGKFILLAGVLSVSSVSGQDCWDYLNVRSTHSTYYICPGCRGYKEIQITKGAGEAQREYSVTCPTCTGYGAIQPHTPYPINYIRSSTPTYYLFLTKAYVRDDGEDPLRGTGDIALFVLGEHYKEKKFEGRLFGPFNQGFDTNNSIKFEWKDYCTMYYDYFPLLVLSDYPWNYVQIFAGEGDEGYSADDTVFNAILDVSDFQNRVGQTIKLEGNCDIPGKCATLWFKIMRCESDTCGDFWDRE